jgi:nucleoside-diphosphate-sugar epimerase
MRILVAGAGYVGAQLAHALASAGHDVLALRRSPRAAPRQRAAGSCAGSPATSLLRALSERSR